MYCSNVLKEMLVSLKEDSYNTLILADDKKRDILTNQWYFHGLNLTIAQHYITWRKTSNYFSSIAV